MHRKEDVHRREKEEPETVRLDESAHMESEPEGQPLVGQGGGGAHVVLSVDDLVALAVLGNEGVILVGQLAGEIVESHRASLLSRTIVTHPPDEVRSRGSRAAEIPSRRNLSPRSVPRQQRGGDPYIIGSPCRTAARSRSEFTGAPQIWPKPG